MPRDDGEVDPGWSRVEWIVSWFFSIMMCVVAIGCFSPLIGVPTGVYHHLSILQLGLLLVLLPLFGLVILAGAVGMWRNMTRRTRFDARGISGVLIIPLVRPALTDRLLGVTNRECFVEAPIPWADVECVSSEAIPGGAGPGRYSVIVHLRDGRKAHTYPHPVGNAAASDGIISQLESARTAHSPGGGGGGGVADRTDQPEPTSWPLPPPPKPRNESGNER